MREDAKQLGFDAKSFDFEARTTNKNNKKSRLQKWKRNGKKKTAMAKKKEKIDL